jgi:stearoyl-CoA desaturase (delta-9 desaturase)
MKSALAVIRWFDAWAGLSSEKVDGDRITAGRIEWLRVVPFILLHAACGLVIWVGWSWTAVAIAALLYLARMFALTGFYHRYFSHRSFRTSRAMQLVFAVAGATAAQRGPLWWASTHRVHHEFTDKPGDLHSPITTGFFWSHMGWFMSEDGFRPRLERIRDLLRYPELKFLDRFDSLVPALTGAALFGFGELLRVFRPELGTSGGHLLVWGAISTILLFHASSSINSVAHRFGWRRYATDDASRNSMALALLTLGEGWHNNHHHYQLSTRQGHYWWEIDITWYVLVLLERLGLIWDLRPVPARVLAEGSWRKGRR